MLVILWNDLSWWDLQNIYPFKNFLSEHNFWRKTQFIPVICPKFIFQNELYYYLLINKERVQGRFWFRFEWLYISLISVIWCRVIVLNRYRRGLENCPQAKTSKSGGAIFFSFFRSFRATNMTQRRVENSRVHFWTFLPESVKIKK